MFRVVYFSFFLLMMGCTYEVEDAFSEMIDEANKAVLYEYAWNGEMREYVPIRELNKSEITRFKELMNINYNRVQHCSFDGAVFFYNDDEVLLRMRFNLKEDCLVSVYMLQGELHTKTFSKKLATYLRENFRSDIAAHF